MTNSPARRPQEYRALRRAGMPLLLLLLTIVTVSALDSLAAVWLLLLWIVMWIAAPSACWLRSWGTLGMRIAIATGIGWCGLWLGLGLHQWRWPIDEVFGYHEAGWPRLAYIGRVRIDGVFFEERFGERLFDGPGVQETGPLLLDLLVFLLLGAVIARLLPQRGLRASVLVLRFAAPATLVLAHVLGFTMHDRWP